MINKSKGVENDFNEDDFFRIMVKAAKIDFEQQYPPKFLKKSWTELVKHTL